MPFKVERRDDTWIVVNTTTGKVKGKHKTKWQAQAHQRALYAHIPEAREKK